MAESTTEAAIAAIGADKPDSDWILTPEEHRKSLPAAAAPLARILDGEAVHQIMANYTAADRRATETQDTYKRLGRRAILARLGAILIGGVFLMIVEKVGPFDTGLVQAALFIQYICIVVAITFTTYLSVRGLFSRWMTARAEAELSRLALFNTVVQQDEPVRDGELPLLPLKLEYFRRYQLDVEQRYYLGRGQQHQRAAGQSRRGVTVLNTLNVVAFLPLVFVALDYIGVLRIDSPWPYLIFLGIGTVVSGVLGTIAAISSMNLDERNASRYLVVHENLRDLAGESLEHARAAAARGDYAAVKLFVDAVQRLISSEHQEWIVLREHLKRSEQLVSVALEPVRVGMR